MVGTRRITGCGTDAAVGFRDQFIVRQVFPSVVGPVFLAYLLVQVFSKCLGQPVGQRFQEYRAVIVVMGLESLDAFIDSESCRNGERPDVILDARCPAVR